MPEGPEVKIITNWLSKKFEGCTIVKNSKFPQVDGYTISKITCKGKQIFFHLLGTSTGTVNSVQTRSASAAAGTKMYFNSRLALFGKWSLTEEKHTRFWMELIPKEITGDKTKTMMLYNHDRNNFGALELLDEAGFISKLDDIGPDLLSEEIDYNLWVKKITNGRIKNKQLCDYLLEQGYFSGIGNYLKCEIMYLCGIKPDRCLKDLTTDEIKRLYDTALKTIKEAYSYGGLTIDTFWSPEGEKGVYPTRVYNREKDDLGNAIIQGKFKDKRGTYWVPEIQK